MFWMIGGIYASAMAWAIIPHYGRSLVQPSTLGGCCELPLQGTAEVFPFPWLDLARDSPPPSWLLLRGKWLFKLIWGYLCIPLI